MNRHVLWVGSLCFVGLAPAALACPFFSSLRPLVQRMPYADEKVKLQPKFEKGKDFFVETTTLTKQKMKVMGQEVDERREQVFVHHWQPVRMTENGDWIVSVRIVHIFMMIDIGANHIKYDSSNKTPTTTMTTLDWLLKGEFTLSVQPNGGIRKIEGREKLLKEIAAESPLSSDSLKTLLNEEALRNHLCPGSAFLTAADVAPGDNWTQKDKLDLGPIGRYVTTFNYTYHAAVGCMHEIRVISFLNYAPPSKDERELPFVIKNADLRSQPTEGKILFDAAKGRLHELSYNLRLAGSLVIEVGSMHTQVNLEHMQSMRVRTMDTFVRPKAK